MTSRLCDVTAVCGLGSAHARVAIALDLDALDDRALHALCVGVRVVLDHVGVQPAKDNRPDHDAERGQRASLGHRVLHQICSFLATTEGPGNCLQGRGRGQCQ